MENILVVVWATLILANVASILLAALRLSVNGTATGAPKRDVPVSVVIPVRGIETFTRETLANAFTVDWDSYELIFCVADAGDPVIGEIRSASQAHPKVPVRVLVGDHRISANPKLNNCYKGWQAARHEWVVLADSNVLMPPDYIARLFAAWRPKTGLVCSTPLGARPDGFWAEVECVFLNTLQTRWQYAGEAIGLGFAQGKSMLWNKPLLDANGGIQALAAEIAEDAAATKLVRRLGRKVHLVASPFEQPLGPRTADDVWARQSRWGRLRRVTFPLFFTPEILMGALPPLLIGLCVAAVTDVDMGTIAAATLIAIYLPEILLAYAKNWHLSLMTLPAMIVRDLMIPAVWFRSWMQKPVEWRGNTMAIGTRFSELKEAPTAPQSDL